jgi:chromosome segregation ATPase
MMKIKHVDKAEFLEELWKEVLDSSQDLKAINDEVDAAKDVLRELKARRKDLEAAFDAVNARYIAVKLDTTKPL